MKKPTFFISSTIYDFSDLRSAIKYHLESQGCEVLTSESNDFKKSLDRHSYEECLNSIKRADYFILLVGSRVGGWFDKDNKISITRKEYQEAYKLHLEGRLRIFNFARSDIWNLRDDRARLKKHLENLNIKDIGQTKSIMYYPTKYAEDPDFIIDFLDEISRRKETKDALDEKGALPTGNWVHSFNSFRDIMDVLTPEIFNGDPIEDAVMKKLLLMELKQILGNSLVKFEKGNIHSPYTAISMFYQEHQLNIENKNNEFLKINAKYFDLISTLSYQLLQVQYNPLILPQALKSSVFLEFNKKIGAFTETPLYNLLMALQKEIQEYSTRNISKELSIVSEYAPKNRPSNLTTINVNTFKFVTFMYTIQRWSNIIELSKTAIKCLQGAPFEKPSTFGRSPIVGMDEEFANETVTPEELDRFILNNN